MNDNEPVQKEEKNEKGKVPGNKEERPATYRSTRLRRTPARYMT